MVDNPLGEESYRQLVEMVLYRIPDQLRSPLVDRYRRAFQTTFGNETVPDCASHGDDSFQEDHFSGIPTTLCINIGFFAITILVFSFIRRNAWNYGVMAIQRDETGILASDDDRTLLEQVNGLTKHFPHFWDFSLLDGFPSLKRNPNGKFWKNGNFVFTIALEGNPIYNVSDFPRFLKKKFV